MTDYALTPETTTPVQAFVFGLLDHLWTASNLGRSWFRADLNHAYDLGWNVADAIGGL